ncbi:hypothetical protein IE53DRAFT_54714 [Violaceomyces palustris]|uniref:Uncharacterized protein n=1 Tax=Violaceomyces palustris TaxID=1673888 RepID=A0ACD0NZR3_9BASI|nr:hypothetical protein IE53DRAFT_54714 [Violaceomyces palustris]
MSIAQGKGGGGGEYQQQKSGPFALAGCALKERSVSVPPGILDWGIQRPCFSLVLLEKGKCEWNHHEARRKELRCSFIYSLLLLPSVRICRRRAPSGQNDGFMSLRVSLPVQRCREREVFALPYLWPLMCQEVLVSSGRPPHHVYVRAHSFLIGLLAFNQLCGRVFWHMYVLYPINHAQSTAKYPVG